MHVDVGKLNEKYHNSSRCYGVEHYREYFNNKV
jgi:hypothetical protein